MHGYTLYWCINCMVLAQLSMQQLSMHVYNLYNYVTDYII